MSGLSVGARIIGGAAALGGGALLAVGAVNSNASSEADPFADLPAEVDTAMKQLGVTFDSGPLRSAVHDRDATASNWQRAGLATEISGGLALTAGVAALATHGRASTILGIAGLAAGALAGAAGLYGWHEYDALPSKDSAVETQLGKAFHALEPALTAQRGGAAPGSAPTGSATTSTAPKQGHDAGTTTSAD